MGDDPDVPRVLKSILQEEHDVTCDMIPDMHKALERVSAGQYHVVFAEHEPPSFDGIQLVRDLRAKGMFIPFILSCARKERALAEVAYCSEVDFFFEKEENPESNTSVLKAMILMSVREETFRRIEERVKNAIETAGLVVWEWDPVTDKLTFIIEIPEIFGYQGSEIEDVRAHYRHYIHPADLDMVREAYLAHKKEKSPHFEVEARIRGKDGRWEWMNIHGKIIERNEKGIPVRVIGTFHDITEMITYRDAINAANKKLNLLGSVTRHDVLNQIMVVLGYLTLLDEMLPSESELREYCHHATEATKRIRRQITFTRDYQDLGVRSPEWQLVDDVIRLAEEIIIPSVTSLKVETGSLEIFADPLLEKVFSNLFENSLRHGEHVTEICVAFREEGGRGILTVEDNGVGIPDGKKTLIFERGFGDNTGLGLFLVREILDITGLGIRETGIPGNGARFEITVPPGAYRYYE